MDWDQVAPCSSCRRETFHDVLRSVDVADDYEEPYTGPGVVPGTYMLIQCRGCGQVSMAHHVEWDDFTEKNYYPAPAFRKPPWWCNQSHINLSLLGLDASGSGMPVPVRELLLEVYRALGGGQYRLAFMGIRAFFEQIMVLQVGDQGTFSANLNAFYEKGYISLVQRDAMNDILDAGHAVMHRLFKPSERDLQTALDIAEGIFAAIYVHPEDAARLADRVPARKGKAGKKRTAPPGQGA